MPCAEELEIGRTDAFRRRDPAISVYDEERDERDIEQEAYREAAQKCTRHWNAGMAHMMGRAMTDRKCTMQQVMLDLWTVAYAFGSYLCNGVSITNRAHMLGVERATLSRAIVDFTCGADLPPSQYLRQCPDTMRSYRESRLRSITKENAKG